MKKYRIISIIILLILCITTTSILIIYNEKPVGFYRLYEIKAGDVIMTKTTAHSLGINMGYLKLQKSGKAKIKLLDDIKRGTWECEDDKLTVTCGEDIYTGEVGIGIIHLQSKDYIDYLFETHSSY